MEFKHPFFVTYVNNAGLMLFFTAYLVRKPKASYVPLRDLSPNSEDPATEPAPKPKVHLME